MSEPLPTREAAQRLGISQAWLLKLARQAGVGQRRRHARGRGWGFDDDALAAIDGLRRQGPWVGHGQASAPETLAAITAISEGLRLADAATIVGIAPKTLSARLAVLGLSVREIQATPLLHEMRLSPAALRDARARAGLSQAALAERDGRVRVRLKVTAEDLLTVSQVAGHLGITPGRVRVLARTRGVGRRLGRDWLFSEDHLAALAVRRPGRPPGERRSELLSGP